MRKVFLFCVLVAGIAMMTGCKKEQTVVTLKAVINQDTKTYIGEINGALYPFWNEGDAVRINGVERVLQQVDRTYATIPDVESNDNGYYAIFPSICVRTMDITNGTAQINVPLTQSYKKVTLDGGQEEQRVDMPMAAWTDGDVLQFKNLACIVKVNVANNIPEYLSDNTTPNPDYGPLTVERIIVYSDPQNSSSVILSGIGNVDIAAGSMTVGGSTSVILTGEYNDEMETIQPGDDHPFYIVVPPFTGKIDIKVETTTGKHREFKLNTVTATASHMASITLGVDKLVGGGDAYLDEGTVVRNAMQSLLAQSLVDYPNNCIVQTIIFSYETSLPNSYNVGVDAFRVDDQREGGIPIYVALTDPQITNPLTGAMGRTLKFFTAASNIYANKISSHMFENIGPIQQISGFDPHFITDLVEDMSYMFANNNSSSKFMVNGIEALNTTHVKKMDHMFAGNTKVSGLDLSHFSSASLNPDGMVGMFDGCSNLQELDMSSFHTSQITTMQDLFNGCVKMSILQINNFDMSNVTNKSSMCTGLGTSNHSAWNRGDIYCPSNLVGDDANPGPLVNGTGINASLFNFHSTVIQ